ALRIAVYLVVPQAARRGSYPRSSPIQPTLAAPVNRATAKASSSGKGVSGTVSAVIAKTSRPSSTGAPYRCIRPQLRSGTPRSTALLRSLTGNWKVVRRPETAGFSTRNSCTSPSATDNTSSPSSCAGLQRLLECLFSAQAESLARAQGPGG